MTGLSFAGFVDSDTGKLVLDQRDYWRQALKDRIGQRVVVVLERPRRSSRANRRYWKRIVETLRQRWSVGREVPLSKSQVHGILARTFLGEDETPLGFVPMETHTLPSDAFYAYCEAIEGHFIAEGVDFPDVESGGRDAAL